MMLRPEELAGRNAVPCAKPPRSWRARQATWDECAGPGPRRDVGDMRMHGAVGEHDIDVAVAGAARLPFRQRDRAGIGNEARFPEMPAGRERDELALTRKRIRACRAVREGVGMIEQEALVAEDIHE